MKLLLLMALFVTGLNAQEFKPIPKKVKFDKKKVELGKKLFFEPRLSKSGRISCNSCHNLAMGGDDNMPSSIGHKWAIGPINSPTVLNSRYNFVQFWDGRAKDLKDQASGPIENPKEMGFTHPLAVKNIKSIPAYVKEFKKAGYKEVNIDNIADAIAKFEETLITPNSRFDKYLRGNKKALTKKELAGFKLFKDKGCASCHSGILLGGDDYQTMGAVKPYHDKKTVGRFAVTKDEDDKYSFKTPTLRNIELTAPYFHDGYTYDLKKAVIMMADLQLGMKLKDDEADKITAFLKTLTGDQPKIVYPILPAETSSTLKPEMN
jgi:cytochrome c peroxidase